MGIAMLSLWFGLTSVCLGQLVLPIDLPLQFVSEMEPLTFLDGGAGDLDCEDISLPSEEGWAVLHGEIVKQIGREQVIALSQWALPQMQGYQLPKEWSPRKLEFARCSDGVVVLESTLDDLPSHNPLVVRKLKVFLVSDVSGSKPLEIVVTIRGEVFEILR